MHMPQPLIDWHSVLQVTPVSMKYSSLASKACNYIVQHMAILRSNARRAHACPRINRNLERRARSNAAKSNLTMEPGQRQLENVPGQVPTQHYKATHRNFPGAKHLTNSN